VQSEYQGVGGRRKQGFNLGKKEQLPKKRGEGVNGHSWNGPEACLLVRQSARAKTEDREKGEEELQGREGKRPALGKMVEKGDGLVRGKGNVTGKKAAYRNVGERSLSAGRGGGLSSKEGNGRETRGKVTCSQNHT